ncbi:MAG TPA: LptA/OstA family protein [bacterium]|nr:LptA/OstA family protein [bacterium]
MRSIGAAALALWLATTASAQVPLVPPMPPGPAPSAPAAPAPAAPPATEGQLHADHVRYDVRTRALAAEGHVILTVGDTQIRADHLTYEPDALRVRAGGAVVVTRGEAVIQAPAVTFDVGADTMAAAGGVRLAQAEGTLTGDALQANLRTHEVQVSGAATLTHAGGPGHGAGATPTVITAPRILFHADAHEAQADGGVTLTQHDRVARAERLRYSETADRADLDGHVVLTQSASAAPTAPAAPVKPAPPVTLACDRLAIRLVERDMQADGNVTVGRGPRSATGDRAVYTERDHRMIVTGNARMVDGDGSRLRADQVIISLTDDAFEGSGHVETEFRVKRNTGHGGAPAVP